MAISGRAHSHVSYSRGARCDINCASGGGGYRWVSITFGHGELLQFDRVSASMLMTMSIAITCTWPEQATWCSRRQHGLIRNTIKEPHSATHKKRLLDGRGSFEWRTKSLYELAVSAKQTVGITQPCPEVITSKTQMLQRTKFRSRLIYLH